MLVFVIYVMRFHLSIHNLRWQTVFTIPKGEFLVKGRHGSYYEITKTCGSISDRFGCYAWKNESIICYCGSYAQDYKRKRDPFKSNLHGRVHNYLQNHKVKRNGHINTNLMVFQNINRVLQESSIELAILRFDTIEFDEQVVGQTAFSQSPDLVHAVEQLLICTYRKYDHCQWNRK